MVSRETSPAPITPVIIVLGGRIVHGRPGTAVLRRLYAVMEEYHEARRLGLNPYIVCTGGHGSTYRSSEASVMAAWLHAQGVPEQYLLVEDHARTTQENFAFSAQLLRSMDPVPGLLCSIGDRKVAARWASNTDDEIPENCKIVAVVVTSWQHVPRSDFWARHYGFLPIMRGSTTPLRSLPKAVLWEVGAVGMAVARGLANWWRAR